MLPQSISYFRTYFYGAVAFVLYNICMGILQAVGDSRHPLYYLIISSITNVVLENLKTGKESIASALDSQGKAAKRGLTLLLKNYEKHK